MNPMKLQLGSLTEPVNAAIRDAETQQVVKRIWRKDASLWKSDLKAQENIRNSLGWLTVASEMFSFTNELSEYSELTRQRGFRHVMVCGMGGSSLCPEVLRRSFGPQPRFPELIILDSTDADVLADLATHLELEKCLFVIASKSGSTIEPTVFQNFWYEYLKERVAEPGDNFIAITDPGSPLVERASNLGFQRVFINQADIGGRFSALSYFGMLPAALAGIDIHTFLDRAKTVSQLCSPAIPAESNPGLQLGIVIGECARAGRDKLTLIIEERLASLGLWVEQLVAESTGKEGKGILPVAGEPLANPVAYDTDRVFVSISLGEPGPVLADQLNALQAAGHPVVQRSLHDLLDLGGEFFVWEFATACAGWRLGINPFDQPDVQLSKEATKNVLAVFEKENRLPQLNQLAEDGLLKLFTAEKSQLETDNESVETILREHISTLKRGDYFAVLCYMEETSETDPLLRELQRIIRDRTHCPATTGYGPRYLHSTGQLHKGGPNTGVFLQIIANDETDFAVPGEAYSFTVLKRAQAFGDLQALAAKGRRVLGVDIGSHGVKALARMLTVLAS